MCRSWSARPSTRPGAPNGNRPGYLGHPAGFRPIMGVSRTKAAAFTARHEAVPVPKSTVAREEAHAQLPAREPGAASSRVRLAGLRAASSISCGRSALSPYSPGARPGTPLAGLLLGRLPSTDPGPVDTLTSSGGYSPTTQGGRNDSMEAPTKPTTKLVRSTDTSGRRGRGILRTDAGNARGWSPHTRGTRRCDPSRH